MRQITDMRAGAFNDLAVGVDQRVGLARQRLDLNRKPSGELLGLAGADRGKTPQTATLEEMDNLWNQAKAAEQTEGTDASR